MLPRLYDNHGRPLTYLRLAVTDRCNLRCFYCMPEEGIRYLPKRGLLTFEEIVRVVSLLAGLGIYKLRFTGGEPFLRKDLMKLIRSTVHLPGIKEFHVTTNGVLTGAYIEELKALGIASVNLSLDTLDRERFQRITHRDEFPQVYQTLQQLLHHGIPVKINAVVMEGKNIGDMVPLVRLTQELPVSVRFIEEMPFNGGSQHYPQLHWTHSRILDHLLHHFPDLQKIRDPAYSTASHYRVPGYTGDIGIIAAFSRTFCGTCNRIRITAQGVLKTCLYDNGVLNLRDLLRSGCTDQELQTQLLNAFASRAKNGWEAEQDVHDQGIHQSMSTIGG